MRVFQFKKNRCIQYVMYKRRKNCNWRENLKLEKRKTERQKAHIKEQQYSSAFLTKKKTTNSPLCLFIYLLVKVNRWCQTCSNMSSSGPPGARLQSADWPQRSQFSAQLRPSSGMKVRRAVIGADKHSVKKKCINKWRDQAWRVHSPKTGLASPW